MKPCEMLQRRTEVVENVRLAESTFRIRFRCPEIAERIRPGQFLMVRLPGRTDPLLARPFALYDIVDDTIDVVYLVVGKMTKLLADVTSGESLDVWGPLGNGFLDVGTPDHVTLVAGGIGQTPFLAYVRELLGKRGVPKVSLYYGVRSSAFVAGVEAFREAGATVHLSSDDGSIGYHGFVTQLLASHRPTGPIIACGPEPMLHAVAKLAAEWNTPCQVSLETPMACGIGICFSCVTKVQQADGEWDYKRVCVDGPVFDASKLVW